MFGPRVCVRIVKVVKKKRRRQRRRRRRVFFFHHLLPSLRGEGERKKKTRSQRYFRPMKHSLPSPGAQPPFHPSFISSPHFLLPLFSRRSFCLLRLLCPCMCMCVCVVNDRIPPEGGPPLATPSSFIRRAVPSSRYTRPSPVG